MTWTSSEPRDSLDPALAAVIQMLESGTADGCAQPVVAARSWLYPLERQRVVFQLSRQRPCTVVEEFIFKAACLPGPNPPDTAEVAQLLGLDEVFIRHATAGLAARAMIEADALPQIRFTRQGRRLLEQGQVADTLSTESLEYHFDRKFGLVYAETAPGQGAPAFPAQAALDQAVPSLKEYVNRAFIVRAGQAMGRTIEEPGLGQAVASIINATVVEPARTLMSEAWTWDAACGRAFCHVWDHARQAFFEELSIFIVRNPGVTGLHLARDPNTGEPAARWRN